MFMTSVRLPTDFVKFAIGMQKDHERFTYKVFGTLLSTLITP